MHPVATTENMLLNQYSARHNMEQTAQFSSVTGITVVAQTLLHTDKQSLWHYNNWNTDQICSVSWCMQQHIDLHIL